MTNTDPKSEKELWKEIDRENKIHQSNRAFFAGAFFIIFFSYQFVKLCLYYTNYDEFKNAVRSTEKLRSLGYLLAIAAGVFLVLIGITIRKSPIIDHKRELP